MWLYALPIVYEYYRQSGRGCRNGGIEPYELFARYLRWPHAQGGSGAASYDSVSSEIVAEVRRTEYPVECRASVFAPVYIMVACRHKIWSLQLLKQGVQHHEFAGVSEFRQISAQNDEINFRIAVYIFNRILEIFLGVCERIEMDIAQPCEGELLAAQAGRIAADNG